MESGIDKVKYPKDDIESRKLCYVEVFSALAPDMEKTPARLELLLAEVGLKQSDLQKSLCSLI